MCKINENLGIPLCIPKIEKNITVDFIKKTIANLHLGEIIKITDIRLKSDTEFKRVLLMIKLNPSSKYAQYIEDRFKRGENIKIVYDAPWYLKLVPTSK